MKLVRKRQIYHLIREDVTSELWAQGVVSLKGLGAKTNWLVVNRQM
jgi:hypothetical protein